MSEKTITQHYEQERKALREELHSLKNCQITFLTTSITSTGVLLGLVASLVKEPYKGSAFLFPLIVLLPSWWIFFDKATTITRVVGYYRLLENLILGRGTSKNFVGWENGLHLFRQMQREGSLKSPENKERVGLFDWIKEMIFFKTGHRYWIISYYTFFSLSAFCLGISKSPVENIWNVLSLLILFLISSVWNARMVWYLIHKKYSYDWNEEYWKQILKIE